MYRAKTVRFSDTGPDSLPLSPVKPEKVKDTIYFRSTNLHVRLLSSFIILKTLSQGKSDSILHQHGMQTQVHLMYMLILMTCEVASLISEKNSFWL